MSLGSRLLMLLCSLALVVGASPAGAATTSHLALSAPAAYAGSGTTLSVVLTDDDGAVAGAPVRLERRTGGTWTSLGTVTTDAGGRAHLVLTVSKVAADNVVRATYDGDAGHSPATADGALPILRRATTVSLSGPRSVVDERSITLRIGWSTTNGRPVAGRVAVYSRSGSGPWRFAATVATGSNGAGRLVVRPRVDTRFQVRAPGLDWVTGARSRVLTVDNRPAGKPVTLPKAAPRPRRHLPAQARAVGTGANVAITAIGDALWSDMVGRTWHSGCPVGRDQLRLVRVNYWDYRGYRRRGELVANADAARAMGSALAELYRRKLPLRSLYREDRFGWSKRLHGADDYASMAAGNSSAFNCRDVVGRPGVRSPHATGRALDLNTWENPYRSAHGIVPDRWWQSHSHPRVAWRTRSHIVVRVMARHGLRWTYGKGDTQHFDYVGSSQRAAVAPMACKRFCD